MDDPSGKQQVKDSYTAKDLAEQITQALDDHKIQGMRRFSIVGSREDWAIVVEALKRHEPESLPVAWMVEGKNMNGHEQTWFYLPDSPFVPAHREHGHKMTPLYATRSPG